MLLFSHAAVSDSFAAPKTVTCQAPLSVGFHRQVYGVGCNFLLQGIFPTLESNHVFCLRKWGFFFFFLPLSHQGSPKMCVCAVAKSCLTLCDPMNCSTPGFPALHHLLEFAQVHIHWVSDAIQPSHPPSSPTFSVSQHHGLFQWVGSLHQVAKVLKLQLQHQSFQWIFRVHFL